MRLDPEKVRRAREVNGFGMEDAAAAAGLALRTIFRAEHAEDVRPLTAKKIADAYGVEVADLYGDEDEDGEITLVKSGLRGDALTVLVDDKVRAADEYLKWLRGVKPENYTPDIELLTIKTINELGELGAELKNAHGEGADSPRYRQVGMATHRLLATAAEKLRAKLES